eukprot:5604336-Pleurochrysis_carterae.AAC.1
MSSGPFWSPSPLALLTKLAGDGRPPCPSLLTLIYRSSPYPSHPTTRGLVYRLHIIRLAKAKG